MTQKTRIEPLPPKRTGLLTRAMYRIAKRRYGQVPEPFTVAAHHRGLMIAGAMHETMLDRASKTLPVSVRELAVFWTARTVGCSWCVDFGSMLQRLDGLDIARLKEIDNYASGAAFSDDERAAIAYADAIWRAGGDAELHVWAGAFHACDIFAPHTAVGRSMIRTRDSWLEKILAD